MDTLNDDTIYHIMKFLPMIDTYHLGLTSRKNYHVFSNDDRLWKLYTKTRFGNATKNDIYAVDPTWKQVYRSFAQTYNEAIAHLEIRGNVKSFVLNGYKTFLYRDDSKAMVIPDKYYRDRIKPRHGDMIIDLEQVGYRNEGVTFYNDKSGKCIPCCFDIDDYGSVPLVFSWPTFPLTYYTGLIDHNMLVNLQFGSKDITYNDGIFTITSNGQTVKIKLANGPLSLDGFNVLAFENERYYYERIVVMELVTCIDDIFTAGIVCI